MHLRQFRKVIYLVLLGLVTPAFAIVIQSSTSTIPGFDSTATDYLAPFDTVKNGVNLNGVVKLDFGGGFCSGALISATQVLTAAHCFGGTPTVQFIDNTGSFVDRLASSFVIDPDYTGFPSGSDLAIVNLDSAAPSFATIYQIFSGTYVPGAAVTLAGFGYSGTGTTGYTTGTSARRVGENAYDADGTSRGVSANFRVGDFDGGSTDPTGSTVFPDEVDLAPGDSGGPSFYNGQIIGIHSFIDCDGVGCVPTSSYGEYFGDVAVAANLAFVQENFAPEPSTWLLCFAAMAAVVWLKAPRIHLRRVRISADIAANSGSVRVRLARRVRTSSSD